MSIEIIKPKIENIETIQIRGNPQQIMGIKSAKTESSYIQAKINHFRKYPNIKFTGNEIAMMFESILAIHKKFYPELESVKVYLEPWRGKSGYQLIPYTEYFDVIDYRKKDKYEEGKELHHKVYKNSILAVQKALDEIKTGDKIKTRDFGEIWARVNHIWENAEGKKIFDNNGYNWSNIQGCRKTLFDLYYSLKVYEWYKIIEHKKSGYIIKLKNEEIRFI
jgi:hypothetical protein